MRPPAGSAPVPPARAAYTLEGLWNLFPPGAIGPPPPARSVPPGALPHPFRRLLVHRRHMTLAMKDRHGAEVEVRVLDRVREGRNYARRSLLTVSGSGRPALLGLVRVDLDALPPAVGEEVLAERKPFGAILIEADLLRMVEPLVFLRIEATPGLAGLLGGEPGGEMWGRIAAIRCGGVSAVELLEVAAP